MEVQFNSFITDNLLEGLWEGTNYLRELPLLNFTVSLFPRINCDDIYIICAQHLVSTTYSLFYALIELGMNPKNISTIGKCYSTDPAAFYEMEKLNIDICTSSLRFDSHVAFDLQYSLNVRSFVKKRTHKLQSNKYSKIIVLDDGGELISEVHSVLGETEKVIGIEQTSSGYYKLLEKRIDIPVINVARSWAKLNFESPIISDLIVQSTLASIEGFLTKSNKVLIIGNGVIGSHVNELLKTSYEVNVFDQISSKSSLRKEKFEESLSQFDMIIGCTGKTILKPSQYKFLKKNAVLVSASSSDREFSAVNLRQNLPLIHDCHQNLFVNTIYLVNCGFPVNFSAKYQKIDPPELQLTRSLLLLSILQAMTYRESIRKRFVPLSIEKQNSIIKKFFELFPDKLYEVHLSQVIR